MNDASATGTLDGNAHEFTWISPVPPAATEIARYSENILRSLGGRLSVSVAAEPQDKVRVSDSEIAAFLNSLLLRRSIAICNIGNNYPYHKLALEVARATPSILILHDFVLQHLFLGEAHLKFEGWEAYRLIMRRCYGAEGEQIAQLVVDSQGKLLYQSPEICKIFPLVEDLGRNCLLGITHNPTLVEDLGRRLAAPVVYAPFPYDPAITASRRPSQDGRMRLVQFGYLGGNRCLNEVLDAIALHPKKHRLKLDVYGSVAAHQDVASKIELHGLASVVTLHGHVSDEILDQALVDADLVINLRNPTMGEASASQLRAFDASAPSVVTDAGWYSELPDGTVLKIPAGEEIHGLSGIFDRWSERPEDLRSVGCEGRRYLTFHHRSDLLVDVLSNLQGEIPQLRRNLGFRSMAFRAAGHARRNGLAHPGLAARLMERVNLLGLQW